MQGISWLVSLASVAFETVTKCDGSAAFRCSIGTPEATFFMIKNSADSCQKSYLTLLNALSMAVSVSLQTVTVASCDVWDERLSLDER
jgi:hypothetical protein